MQPGALMCTALAIVIAASCSCAQQTNQGSMRTARQIIPAPPQQPSMLLEPRSMNDPVTRTLRRCIKMSHSRMMRVKTCRALLAQQHGGTKRQTITHRHMKKRHRKASAKRQRTGHDNSHKIPLPN